MDKTLHSVVTEEDCEILKIPAKEFEKLKLVWCAHLYVTFEIWLDYRKHKLCLFDEQHFNFVQVAGMEGSSPLMCIMKTL